MVARADNNEVRRWSIPNRLTRFQKRQKKDASRVVPSVLLTLIVSSLMEQHARRPVRSMEEESWAV